MKTSTCDQCNGCGWQNPAEAIEPCNKCGGSGVIHELEPGDPSISDFANYPMSITEAKGERTYNAADWTPRDALISALRDLDSGKLDPVALIVCVQERDEGMQYYNASPNIVTALGILDYVKQRIYARRYK